MGSQRVRLDSKTKQQQQQKEDVADSLSTVSPQLHHPWPINLAWAEPMREFQVLGSWPNWGYSKSSCKNQSCSQGGGREKLSKEKLFQRGLLLLDYVDLEMPVSFDFAQIERVIFLQNKGKDGETEGNR